MPILEISQAALVVKTNKQKLPANARDIEMQIWS